MTYERQNAHGLDSALRTTLTQPFGSYLITAMALGFVAFGLFVMVESRYRRM